MVKWMKTVCIILCWLPMVVVGASRTRVVMLGSGNPNPDPDHSGCSVCVVVDETPYLVDFGPGLVRMAAKLSPTYGGPLEAMNVKRFKRAFLTHLHSDHTVGFADLILTPWVMGRDEPLVVYGPEGLADMAQHLLAAYREDIRYRLYGSEPANNQGWRVVAHELTQGLFYSDERVKVEAFLVKHGSWPNAYGFRFTTPDKVVVISGDTTPCDALLKFGKEADILVHEVYYKKGYDTKNEFWRSYHAQNHTSTLELGEIANRLKPKLLVLYHILFWGGTKEDILAEIGSVYQGRVEVGEDLAIYE